MISRWTNKSHHLSIFAPTLSKCSTWTYLQSTEMRICIIYIMFVLYMWNEHLDVILAFYLVISFCIKGHSQITIKITRKFSMNIIKTSDYRLSVIDFWRYLWTLIRALLNQQNLSISFTEAYYISRKRQLKRALEDKCKLLMI